MNPILGIAAEGGIIHIDVDKLIETRLLIQGASGSGKSHVVRRILEETEGRCQRIVFDVEGEYATLREKFAFALAGPGGEGPVAVQSAGLLIRRLLESEASAVIDMHDLTPVERDAFLAKAIRALMAAPPELQHDALIVIEECQLFAPQSGGGDAKEMVEDLGARGRKKGFCLVAVTQRMSDLSKTVVAQCGNRLIGKTTLDTDIRRAANELGFGKREQAHSLARLARGEFFVFGPALVDHVVKIKVAATATKAPERRGREAPPPPPTPAALRSLLAPLASLPKEAEKEVADLSEAKARISRLEAEKRTLLAAPKARPKVGILIKPPPPVLVPVLPKMAQISLRKDAEAVMKVGHAVTGWAGKVLEALRRVGSHKNGSPADGRALDAVPVGDAPAGVKTGYERLPVTQAPPALPAGERVASAPPLSEDYAGDLSGPERRILGAMASLEYATGRGTQENVAIACVAGYTSGEQRGYQVARGPLVGKGLIGGQFGKYWLTEDGRSARATSGGMEVLTPVLILNRVLANLSSGPERRILQAVYDHPEGIDNERLAVEAGYESGDQRGFQVARGPLVGSGLIVREKGVFTVAPFLRLTK